MFHRCWQRWIYHERCTDFAVLRINRMAETRVIERVDRACFLPKTPEKKAQVVERILESPRTRNILESKGILKTPKERREDDITASTGSWYLRWIESSKKVAGVRKKRPKLPVLQITCFWWECKEELYAKKTLSKLVSLNSWSISQGINKRKVKRQEWMPISRSCKGVGVQLLDTWCK